jgi:hypothetical protein
VVELKCAERLANEHTAQCLNYLRAPGGARCRVDTIYPAHLFRGPYARITSIGGGRPPATLASTRALYCNVDS